MSQPTAIHQQEHHAVDSGNKMENYAIQLKTPSMYMFYLGVLLPLILIIVGSGKQNFQKGKAMFAVYLREAK